MDSFRPVLYICAPYRHATPADVQLRNEAIKRACELGWAPIFAPYLMPWINEADDEQRQVGLSVALSLVRSVPDALLVLPKEGTREGWSEGMQAERSEWHISGGGERRTFMGLGALTRPELPHSDAAVRLEKTVAGWACKVCGRWWGEDERMARYCHTLLLPCDDCGKVVVEKKRSRTCCEPCTEKRDRERYLKLPLRPWNGLMIYSDARDEYYADTDAVEEAAREAIDEREPEPRPGERVREILGPEVRLEIDAMRLRLTEPVYGRSFDVLDHLSDDLPDDHGGDPYAVAASLKGHEDNLNFAIRELGPLSYMPSDARLNWDAVPVLDGEAALRERRYCGCGGRHRGWCDPTKRRALAKLLGFGDKCENCGHADHGVGPGQPGGSTCGAPVEPTEINSETTCGCFA